MFLTFEHVSLALLFSSIHATRTRTLVAPATNLKGLSHLLKDAADAVRVFASVQVKDLKTKAQRTKSCCRRSLCGTGESCENNNNF